LQGYAYVRQTAKARNARLAVLQRSVTEAWLESKLTGDLMYQLEECIAQALICRGKAHADPAHYDYWIDEAIVWHQRAIGTGHKNAVTREVHVGRLIPKQIH
jgi:hypothetical protein